MANKDLVLGLQTIVIYPLQVLMDMLSALIIYPLKVIEAFFAPGS